MLSKEEIEKARSNILRGNDIESACLIIEAVLWKGLVQVGGRVDITKVAMRQILNFVKEYKNKEYLDVVREKVKANNRVIELEREKQNAIEKLELRIKFIEQNIKLTNDYYYRQELKVKLEITQEILSLAKGENDG